MDREQAPRSAAEVRQFFTGWLDGSNTGDWVEVARLMHPEIVLDDPMSPEPARGHVDAIRRAKQQYEPFPDGHVEMLGDPFVALDEPELAYRWRFTGTHRRPVSPPGFAPTGRKVQVDGTSVLRFRDGQVVHVTLFFDTTAVARQLLAAPPAGSALERVIVVSQRVRVGVRRRFGR